MGMKPRKIKLNNGTATGMYILLDDDEIKYTNTNETKPPSRIYKIEVAIEVMYNNKRVRGKQTFTIPKGTSITKAVSSLLGRKQEMTDTLKSKGTLTKKKIDTSKIDTSDKTVNSCFERFIAKKSINSRPNTVRVYSVNYNTYIKPKLGKKLVTSINEDMVQDLINEMINKKKSANTIKGVIQRVLKQILQDNDVLLNWKKIVLPKAQGNRKYNKPKHITLQIVKTMKEYYHPIANGVFQFLLTGRRVNEVLYLKHENINYTDNTFILPADITKTKKDFTFDLTPSLIDVIKKQKTYKGRIFKLEHRQMLEHFKTAMASIGVYDMVIHDIRSMVAQTALDGGASIYDVSKMLAHEKVATTEQAYVQGGRNQASRAMSTVSELLKLNDSTEVLDVEIVENKYKVIKNLYPNVSDDVRQYAIDILEGNIIQ